jgi:hypothetical protein
LLSEQKKIAKKFEEKSEVGFSNCAGCVDGLLIWMHKPSEKDVKKARVDRKKILWPKEQAWSQLSDNLQCLQ